MPLRTTSPRTLNNIAAKKGADGWVSECVVLVIAPGTSVAV